MAVTADDVRLERADGELTAPGVDNDLTEEDRAALWLYAHLVGDRHRPVPPSPRRRFNVVYDESGYPVQSGRR